MGCQGDEEQHVSNDVQPDQIVVDEQRHSAHWHQGHDAQQRTSERLGV